MREIALSQDDPIPIIKVRVRGPLRSRLANLVFDTGSALTQIDTSFIEYIGYSASDGEQRIRLTGATGEAQEGYSVRIAGVTFLGWRFTDVLVGAMDFDHLALDRIDGLLGWDIIRALHLELNGPNGKLLVYSKPS